MEFYRVNIEKIIRLKKIGSIGHRVRVLGPFEVKIFYKYPFKVIFRETSNGRRFFLEHLLRQFFFQTCLIFRDLRGRPQYF